MTSSAVSHTGASHSTGADGLGDDNSNPLLRPWTTEPFNMPPFSLVQPCHFKPAFAKAMALHLEDLTRIVEDPEAPSFDNVLAAFDRAGQLMHRIGDLFSNMCSSLNTDALQDVQSEMSVVLARHTAETYTLPGLFDKIATVHKQRHAGGLDPEQIRLVERIHMDFQRQGAGFSEVDKKEYAEIKAELAALQTKFQQNVMKDEEEYELLLTVSDLEGCPLSLVNAARQAAIDRGKGEHVHVITLSRSLVEPFLTYSPRRDLREKAWEAWTKRGELHPDRDNKEIAIRVLKLRQRQAQLHGHKSFADYQCDDRMARTPEKVMELLENVWEKAKHAANRERKALEDFVSDHEKGANLEGGIQPWDWRFYADKVRSAKYDWDDAEMRPYLSLEKVSRAAMAVSNKLYGLRYIPRPDLKLYDPDVNAYEVKQTMEGGEDRLVAIFVADNYARKYKSSGAWMSEYRSQTKNLPAGSDAMESIPIVSNNNNFAKAAGPTLLSFDDATTLFHEFGHAHHGMLSSARYGRLASTNVLTDFVELPSQLMEHWLEEPEVLKEFATHYETGAKVPDSLLKKLKASKAFNEGFATIEYTACSLLDMAMHRVDDYDGFDIGAFEKQELERLGMPQGIVMRHRPPHFLHLFSSSSYAAGYYVYLWAEVLDADAFAAWKETGDIFDKDTSARARRFIYSAGNTEAPDELFRHFRGRDPDIQYMLKKKSLIPE